MKNFKEALNDVKAFAFDVDGVFTNSKLLLHPSGDLVRTMNTRDGFAVKYAISKGYPIAIITGGKSESVRIRFKNLGLTDIYMASSCKIDDFKDFTFKYDLDPQNVLYMGDDLPDFDTLKHCGIPSCPADAATEIKGVSIYISNYNGGKGCVRDVIEQTLRTHGNWNFI